MPQVGPLDYGRKQAARLDRRLVDPPPARTFNMQPDPGLLLRLMLDALAGGCLADLLPGGDVVAENFDGGGPWAGAERGCSELSAP